MTTTTIGELAVRRSIEIDAPPERVWQEFASADRFRLWYTTGGGVDMPCQELEYEPRVGGPFITHVEHGGDGRRRFPGKVLVYDPPRELTVEWGPFDFPGTPAVSLLSFFLHQLPGGRTRAEVVHHGFESFGESARNVYEAFEGGWDMTVPTTLRNLVETGKATG
jgi:uncharacterized protein YndB with AHSA1/START domain